MAIAYYIPDQRKLLLGQYGGGGRNNNNNNHSSHNRNTTATPTIPSNSQNRTTTTATTTTTTTPQINYNNGNFRANITIPLTAFAAQRQHTHNVGCWDLITQVFCYAFRFQHESNHNSAVNESHTPTAATVIQITVEISGGGNDTMATTAAATELQSQQPSPQSTARDKN